MIGPRRLITMSLGLLPLAAGAALQQPASTNRPEVGGPQARVTNPHGAISVPCQNCHTYSSWKPIRAHPEFNHDQTGYPLRGMHEKVGCTECHTNLVFAKVSTLCADCHADIHRGQFGANCESCHTVKGWEISRNAIRDHQNRFPLVGAHALVECDACHKNAAAGQFVGLSTACYSCHQQDFKTTVVDHVNLGFPTTCDSCHTMDTWFNAKFDHLKYTGYALTGVHATLACTACHINNVFAGTPSDCYSCHRADFAGTTSPPHVQLAFPRDCQTCHTTSGWNPAKFDHNTTSFPLTGAHVNVSCSQCHVNNNYTSLPTACYGCHQADFTGTTNPNHVDSGFPTDCTLCHTTTAWNPSTFNHASVFPLTGAHAKLTCTQCHTNNNYTTLPINCFGCHRADWNSTSNPNHATASFPTTCDTCHNTSNWTTVTFNHATYANYPLTGVHATLTCVQCHVNNNYVNTPTACYSCHQADFSGTTSPNHVSSGFPTDCALCHTTSGWSPSSFDHASVFPLTGAHATLTCAQCHTNSNYTTLPTSCFGCHQTDWNSTSNPNHAAAAFPTTCNTCHSTSNWTTVTFNHATYANYPLTGAHATLTCVQCHVNNSYVNTPTACYSCHQTDYANTTSPNHVSSGFPTDCSLCHTTSGWSPSSFNHASVFPLTGAHATVPCAQCHTNNNYTTLPTNCFGCHQADWNSTSNPNHAAAAFPTTCNTCHSTSNWTTVTFNHATYANYPLTGAHATLTCVQCHVNNNYVNTPTACYSCHQADFASTTSPNHVSSGFPTDCSICHTTSGWSPSSFDHASVFPLTGAHATLSCTQCHTNNNWTTLPTNCSGCHQADWNGTTDPNHPAAGFPTTCDTCHTTTAWTGAAFNHNNTLFPLTGAHVSVDCVKCHVNNVYAGTPTDCYSCHSADYSGTTDPNHSAAGWPTTCTTCHTTTGWVPATLPASYHTFFPLKHGNANGVCATCHTNSADYSVFQCTGCHGGNNAANFRHPNVSGYVYNSVNCYACHKNGGGD